MQTRKQLERLVLERLTDKADKSLILRQLDNLRMGDLFELADAPLELIGNRAVFSAHLRIAIVLWHEEYKPQPLQRRHDNYDAAPMIMSDLPAYRCPITGKPITSRSKHRENLKAHGCEVAEVNTPRDNWNQEKAEDHDRKKAVYDAMTKIGYH